MKADTERYLRVMYDIKWRTEIIGYMDREDHPNRDISLLPPFMKVETIALQIRRIIESIVLASLVANESFYKEEAEKFKKLRSVKEIFKHIQKRNPDFYPKPIEPIRITDTDDIDRNIRFIEDGFMTCDMCLEVYQKCSHIVHSQKPFAEDKYGDYEDFMRQVPDWISRIVKLFNLHVFRLVDSNDFYVVHMHDEAIGDYPFMYPLRLEKLTPENQKKLRGERQ